MGRWVVYRHLCVKSQVQLFDIHNICGDDDDDYDDDDDDDDVVVVPGGH